ncbi:amidohydrolase family protein [Roseitranquillus sediminis]|uniref:amidohydrolase family protein n=1 Tax=Roseitranquillus sediminis TaxID=2809051 RepID=UPI001D0C6D40|nr:amidohydrolase family protein [Roseitranquillus sediminis]MBM9593067.1 amidohydrolase [Roseitranquillus sediminis]
MTKIINCHIHTFTTRHTPRYFPFKAAVAFRYAPFLLRWVRNAMRWHTSAHSYLLRLEAFHDTGRRPTQREVLREALHYYPRDAKFVVLPLDMEPIGHGPVEIGIRGQHDELHRLTQDGVYGPRVIPFASVHPATPGAAAEFRRCVETLGFRGLKVYPKLGYAPDHPLLMEEIYPLCVERGLPVISHCSRGGIYRKGWDQRRRDEVSGPEAWIPVMEAHPELRVCLAHFGGDADWRSYINDGFDPDDPDARRKNWVWQINDMICRGDFPNLWTDISYTIFKFDEYAPLLRIFLQERKLGERVLFGSDFYMTRQERLSEKAISIRLRDTLGDDHFRQIAETNPRVFLALPPIDAEENAAVA